MKKPAGFLNTQFFFFKKLSYLGLIWWNIDKIDTKLAISYKI